GQTPLRWACYRGHEGAVRLLPTKGEVNPGKPDKCGDMPFAIASRLGGCEISTALLARDGVIPDERDNAGGSPLWRVCQGRHEEVVRLLLARDDVNPDKPDSNGRTPLSIVSAYG
ncbi:ankyrin, partial [Tuber magnatum]